MAAACRACDAGDTRTVLSSNEARQQRVLFILLSLLLLLRWIVSAIQTISLQFMYPAANRLKCVARLICDLSSLHKRSCWCIWLKLFADDVKIYFSISDIDSVNLLQDSLAASTKWASDWQLKISIGKCVALHLGRKNLMHNYVMNDAVLPNVRETRDVGVIVDSKLCFSVHLAHMTSKAHRRAGPILRCFESRDPHLLFTAFCVYVRPILEYCSSVWSPVYKAGTTKLAAVQRCFIRRLKHCAGFSYVCARLKFLNAETLELRRLIHLLIFDNYCSKV